MQELSIAVLSAFLVLLQPIYAHIGALCLGQVGLSCVGIMGCLGGLLMVLYSLFRAETYALGQIPSAPHREAGWSR